MNRFSAAALALLTSLPFALVHCSEDKGGSPADSGTSVDAAGKDAAAEDAADDGGAVGTECAFNRECTRAARCECVDGNCACALGPRGTGKIGVDSCTSGNDCESSVCLEGPNDALVCSDECTTNDDCGGSLPQCTDVALLGRICVRATPK